MATVDQDGKEASTPPRDVRLPLNDSPNAITGDSTPVLVIPQPRDGFFGYSEEKTLQQVIILEAAAKVMVFTYVAQIEEKYWAHRRGSDAHTEASSPFVASFMRVPSVHGSPPPPGEVPTGPMVFEDDECEHPTVQSTCLAIPISHTTVRVYERAPLQISHLNWKACFNRSRNVSTCVTNTSASLVRDWATIRGIMTAILGDWTMI